MNAYRFSQQDNDSYAFRVYPRLTRNQQLHQTILPAMSGQDRPGVRRCIQCGLIQDKWNAPLNGFRVKRRKHDISCTYDGLTVVSSRFISVCDETGITGPTFRPLPDDTDFFAVVAARKVGFDAERCGTRFTNFCAVCNQYAEVIGAYPTYLREGEFIGDLEIVRSDLEFASRDEKCFLLMCGPIAKERLSKAGLKGVDLYPLDK